MQHPLANTTTQGSAEQQETTSEELASLIMREHAEAMQAQESWLQHAIRAGEYLLEARRRFPPRGGGWLSWLDENVTTVRQGQALRYMRLARHKDELQGVDVLSIKAAMRLISGRNHGGSHHPDEIRKACLQMKAEGVPMKRIASELDVSSTAVYLWCNPKKASEYRARHRRGLAAAGREEKRRQNALRARTADADISSAYGHLRKCLEEIQRSADRQSGEPRRELLSAMNSLYRAEDAIGRALRLMYEEPIRAGIEEAIAA